MEIWNSSLIDEIYEAKDKEKSDDRDNLLRLTSQKLYGDKIHYVLELIQNAEDESSSKVIFEFDNNGLSVINNGTKFDAEDVWGICSVKPGRKRNKIGFFGIGFKSVFNISKSPQIISNEYNFQIDRYIYPQALNNIPVHLKKYFHKDKGAIFYFPYDEKAVNAEDLIQNSKLLDDKILLFLENIENLTFIDNINDEQWVLSKQVDDRSNIELHDSRNEAISRWKVFHRTINIPDDIKVPEGKEGISKTKITIAFPLDDKSREATKKSGVIYCYLPTKQRTDLPFLIQADFIPIISRTSITDGQWNTWLMESLGAFAADALDELKTFKEFHQTFYDLIPLEEEIQDESVKHLYLKLRSNLAKKNLAKTDNGWLLPSQCCIPDHDKIRDILNERDLRSMHGRSLSFVDRVLSKEEEFTRAEDVLMELGAIKIDISKIVDFLGKTENIETRSKEWYLALYDYLSTAFGTDYLLSPTFNKLEKTRFILTDEEILVPLKDREHLDRIICYPQSKDLSEVHEMFSEGDIVFLNQYFQEYSIIKRSEKNTEEEEVRKRIKEWFDSVGVTKYFKQSHIIRKVIVPKFSTGKYEEYDDLKLYALIDYIRTYWHTLESEINNKKLSPLVLEKIKKDIRLKAFKYENGCKIEEYIPPNEIYFTKRYSSSEVMEDLFDGIEGLYYLSPFYLNQERYGSQNQRQGRAKNEMSWKEFFSTLGVWSSPIVIKESEKSISKWDDKFQWVEFENSNYGHKLSDDWISPHVEHLIEYCSEMDDNEIVCEKIRLLWRSISNNWKLYKDSYCSCKYEWHKAYARDWQSKLISSSSFWILLKTSKWVLDTKGYFYKPCETFVDTKENHDLLGEDTIFLSGKASDSFLKDIGVHLKPEINKTLEHLIEFKTNNSGSQINYLSKTNTIYKYLWSEARGLQGTEVYDKTLDFLASKFEENSLIYLPRTDKKWWKPSEMFWQDSSGVFDILRGSIEFKGTYIYEQELEQFFCNLGVERCPGIKECLNVLSYLKENKDLKLYNKISTKIYSYMNRLLQQNTDEHIEWGNHNVFLCEKETFSYPSDIYYCDTGEFRDYFEGSINLLKIDFSWDNIEHLLESAGFKRLSQNVSIHRDFGNIKEIDGNLVAEFKRRLSYVKNHMKHQNYELYDRLNKRGILSRIEFLEIYHVDHLKLKYCLQDGDQEPIVIEDINKQAFYSSTENRLYKLSGLNLFSSYISREVLQLFEIAQSNLHPIVDSLISIDNEGKLREKLEFFGIAPEGTSNDDYEDEIELIETSGGSEESPTTSETKPKPEVTNKPELPPHKPDVGNQPINPEDYDFDFVEDKTPYPNTEGANPPNSKKIELRKGRGGTKRPPARPVKKSRRIDLEEIALYLVMKYERIIKEREPDDRHTQYGIGYDIYSSNGDMELFIEVKHFQGGAGTWNLTAHQWKMASKEKDNYFVYIVSHLRDGNSPVIDIIQNPVKYLEPNPPIDKEFSNWKNGVIRTVATKEFYEEEL